MPGFSQHNCIIELHCVVHISVHKSCTLERSKRNLFPSIEKLSAVDVKSSFFQPNFDHIIADISRDIDNMIYQLI